MRDDILPASISVLQKYGGLKFTTLRVAEVAGISIGSLYQYFPNKQSLLLALHERAVQNAWEVVQAVLGDERSAPRQKILRIARFFFEVESGEHPQVRRLLEDVQGYFRETPEYRELMGKVRARFEEFMAAANPKVGEVKFATSFVMTTIESMGKAVAARRHSRAEVRKWSDACAKMVSDYLGVA